ncbi:hypothetical protein EDD37DRAFT_698328 [Exophiala viscosa]|uniref:uncharacterized protein n=1 Tax=Exophiala viscosa TaxID=2486360 RepID=UPI002194EC36|nr:hypothetical protein EDD37DRAFT_698328 [Exophiala viscosa]
MIPEKDLPVAVYSIFPKRSGSDEDFSRRYAPHTTVPLQAIRKGPSRLARLSLDNWAWEVGATALCLCILSAIAAVLLAYDNQPVPSLPDTLSINAIISFLASIAKASLMIVLAAAIRQEKWLWFIGKPRSLDAVDSFEEASRGPYGSLRLIMTYRGSLQALPAAFITILPLGFEPFLQQLVTLEVRNVPIISDPATIRTPISYDETVTSNLGGSRLSMTALIGTLGGASGAIPSPICSSGNCTWPAYNTLGMCSICEDMTDHATVSGDIYNINLTAHLQDFAQSNQNATTSSWTPSYSFPNGNSLSSMRRSAMDTVLSTKPKLIPDPHPTRHTMRPNTLRPHHEHKVRSGSLISTRVFTSYGTVSPETPGWTATVNKTTFSVLDSATNTEGHAQLLIQALRTALEGNTTYAQAGYFDATDPSHSYTFDATGFTQVSSPWSSAGQQAIDTADNFTFVAEGVADALTGAFQTLQNTTTAGTALRTQSIITVRWAWIAYPLSLVALGLAALTLTIIATHTQKMALWKESTLPLLFRYAGGLPTVGQNISKSTPAFSFSNTIFPSNDQDSNRVSSIITHAAGQRVQLRRRNGVWILESDKGTPTSTRTLGTASKYGNVDNWI